MSAYITVVKKAMKYTYCVYVLKLHLHLAI